MLNEDIDEVAKRYRIKKFGYIAVDYDVAQEECIYRYASNILAQKYGNIISEQNIYDKIIKKGRIYTLYINRNMNAKGFLEVETGNICVSYIIKEMTENLLHEIVHRVRL